MLFSDIPSDVASKILSFCSCGDLLTLRRTSRSMFPVVLDREFRLRVPIDILKLTACIQDVHMYVRLLHHTMEHSRPLICKTAGSKLFRLRAQDLEGLDRTFKRNVRYWGADDMELFSRVDLFVAALKRHGSVAQLRAYDATIKQRTTAQRAKKQEALVKQKALFEQMLAQRQPFLTLIDEAYKQYLEKGKDDADFYNDYSEFRQQNIENIAQFRAAFCLNRADFYNDYAEFRHQNIAEYRVTFCINDRDEYLCYMQQVNERNLRALQDWQRKSRGSDTRGKKRKATTSDTYCISCLKNLAATHCTNTCCGLCCGTHKRACSRHKN